MREPWPRILMSATLLLAAVALAAGCTSTQEPTTTTPSPGAETPAAANLDAAIATATQSVSDASAYVIGLQQELPGAPTPEDLEKLTTTLNLAATQTGAAQVATAQSALDQFNAGIEKVQQSASSATQDEATQTQYDQLVATLEIGRNALDEALP